MGARIDVTLDMIPNKKIDNQSNLDPDNLLNFRYRLSILYQIY